MIDKKMLELKMVYQFIEHKSFLKFEYYWIFEKLKEQKLDILDESVFSVNNGRES